MLRRDLSIVHALTLFAAILAPACQPDAGVPDATDTAATDTDDTDATDTDATATDSDATDTATSEPTTTDADPTESADTDSTTGDEACVAPDPAASAAVGINFGAWPVVNGPNQDIIELTAECAVDAVTNQDGAIKIDLLCSEGGVVDVAIGIALTAPADFAVELDVGAQVRLQAYWQDEGHHIGTGEWFVLHDAVTDELLLAGLDHDSATAANDALGALNIDPVEGVCEPTCGDDCFDTMDGTERRAFAFTHDDGPSLTLIDQSRGSLSVDGRSFDIILDEAVGNFCLNCWSDYVWIIGSVAG